MAAILYAIVRLERTAALYSICLHFCLFDPLICMPSQEKNLLLYCSVCAARVHPGCLTPPWTETLTDDWSCHSCKEKVENYFKERDAYLTELSKRCLLRKSVMIHYFDMLIWPSSETSYLENCCQV